MTNHYTFTSSEFLSWSLAKSTPFHSADYSFVCAFDNYRFTWYNASEFVQSIYWINPVSIRSENHSEFIHLEWMHFGSGVRVYLCLCVCVCAQEIKMTLKNCFSFNFFFAFIQVQWILYWAFVNPFGCLEPPTKCSGRGEKMCAVSFHTTKLHIAERKIVQ